MSKLSKGAVLVALSAAAVALLTGTSFVVPVSAQTVAEIKIDDLQAIIKELQAKISALQAQVQALQVQTQTQPLQEQPTSPGGTAATCSFSRDLTLGSQGDDVRCLQQYLNSTPYKVAESGPGSPGNETTYFGPLTQAAVAAWQAANGVYPAAGYFGSSSRAKLLSLTELNKRRIKWPPTYEKEANTGETGGETGSAGSTGKTSGVGEAGRTFMGPPVRDSKTDGTVPTSGTPTTGENRPEIQPKGTLVGKISIGPLCPVEPCPASVPNPYTSRMIVLKPAEGGQEISVKMNANGEFTAQVAAGNYQLTITNCDYLGCSRVLPKKIAIEANRTTAVYIDIDTGIR